MLRRLVHGNLSLTQKRSSNICTGSIGLVRHASSIPTQRSAPISTVLTSINSVIQNPATMNVDNVLNDLQQLNKCGTPVPLMYYLAVADVLCARHDTHRTELLIHICKENVAKGYASNQDGQKAVISRPKNEPLNKLISYSISGHFRHGNSNEALMLWMRMTSSGHVTNRTNMEKMLDRISSSVDARPTLAFIDSLRAAMQAHLWNQTHSFHAKLFKIMRIHISTMCRSESDIQLALDRLNLMWLDAVGSAAFPKAVSLQLHALRVHCYGSAMQMSRYHCKGNHNIWTRCNEGGITAIRDLSTSATTSVGENIEYDAGSIADHELRSLVSDMQSILRSATSGRGIISPEQALAPSPVVESSDMINARHVSKVASAQSDTHAALSVFLCELAEAGCGVQAAGLMRSLLTGTAVEVAAGLSGNQLEMRGFLEDSSLSETTSSAESFEVGDPEQFDAKMRRAIAESSVQAVLGGNDLSKLEVGNVTSSSVDSSQWAQDLTVQLAGRIMRKTNAVLAVGEYNAVSSFSVFKNLEDVFLSLKGSLSALGIKATPALYASFVDGLTKNKIYAESNLDCALNISIESAMAVVKQLLNGVDPSIANSAPVRAAQVFLLNSRSRVGLSKQQAVSPEAVQQAVDLLLLMGKEGQQVPVSALLSVLDAATVCLGDRELAALLTLVEDRVVGAPSAGAADAARVLKARMYAHCRLRNGAQALELLFNFRAHSSLSGAVKLEPRMYRWIANALHQATPTTKEEWDVASDPQPTIEFLLRNLAKDGHSLTSDIAVLMVRLYTKAIQIAISKSTGNMSELTTQMRDFVQKTCPEKGVQPNDIIVREVIKTYCVAGNPDAAVKVINNCEALFGFKPTANCYDPVIFFYAGLNNELDLAENLLQEMVNKAIPLTDQVVVPIVLGYIRAGELTEALDCVQDMYNQHRVLPTVSLWLQLLDASLERKDVMEARRVVALVRQLYTPAQRASLLGPRLTDPRAQGSGAGIAALQKVQASGSVLDQRATVVSSYWEPARPAAAAAAAAAATETLERDGGDRRGEKRFVSKSGGSGSNSNSYAEDVPTSPLPHGYLLKLSGPVGQQVKGVLSDSALKTRFELHGLKL
jgi:pentatricopeptide repeat protein